VLVAGGIGRANAFALTSAEAYRPTRGTRITQGSLNTGRNAISHLDSHSSNAAGEPAGQRHRPIHTRSTIQASRRGGRTKCPGSKPIAQADLPACVLPNKPLSRIARRYDPTQTEPPRSSFMPRKGGAPIAPSRRSLGTSTERDVRRPEHARNGQAERERPVDARDAWTSSGASARPEWAAASAFASAGARRPAGLLGTLVRARHRNTATAAARC